MDLRATLDLFDRDERREADEPGMRREEAGSVIRQVDLHGTSSCVIYSALDAADADAAIAREVRHFDALGHDFEWKLYAHDMPEDLHERLLAHGFVAEEQESVMVLDLARIPRELLAPTPSWVRRLEGPRQLRDAARVYAGAFGVDGGPLEERLTRLMCSHPDRLSVYVAYVGDEPVCAARVQFSARGHFAGLWGGGTLPEHRGRGFYTAVLAARVQEALRRGLRFVMIDAGPMSRPIVEHHGFCLLTHAQAHIHSSPRPA